MSQVEFYFYLIALLVAEHFYNGLIINHGIFILLSWILYQLIQIKNKL